VTSQREDDERKTPSAEAALPSVIVDEGLLSEARARESDRAPKPTASSNAPGAPDDPPRSESTLARVDPPAASSPSDAAPPAPPPAGEATPPETHAATADRTPGATAATVGERLSFVDADRFAASIRPSWDPPTPASAATVTFASAPAPAMAPVATPIEDDAIVPSVIPPRIGKTTGLFVAAGCIVGFGALLVYAITGGEAERPESWKNDPPAHDSHAHAAGAPSANAPHAPPHAHETAAVAPAPEPIAPAPTPTEAVLSPSPAEPTAPPAPPAAAAPTEPAAAPPPSAAKAPPAKPDAEAARVVKVRIRVSTTPRTAQLRLDGARVSNPFDGTVAQAGQRVFEARAPGYQTLTRIVVFDRSQVVALKLDRLASSTPPAASTKPTTTGPKKRTTASGAQRTSEPPRKGAAFVADSPY
jgi:hypothetical protein